MTVIKSSGSVEIDRPIDEVFDYTHHNIVEWSDTVVRDEPIHTAPDGGVGSTFLCVTQDRGSQMEFQGTVTQWEPPALSVSELAGKSFDIEVAYAFEDLGERTKVTQVSIVRPKNFILKLFFGLFRGLAQRGGCDATQKELNSLKRCLETRTAEQNSEED